MTLRAGARTAGVVVCWVAGTACTGLGFRAESGDPEARRRVAAHFDQLERTAPIKQVPASARLLDSGRRDTCLDPDFDRDEPALWRRYEYDQPPETILAFYGTTFVDDGWNEEPYRPIQATILGARFAKDLGGWQAAVDVDVNGPLQVVDLTAADRSSQVCPR